MKQNSLFLVTSVADDDHRSAEEAIRNLLGHGWYAFTKWCTYRKSLNPGDRICFYQKGVGVVAEATVVSQPKEKVIEYLSDPARFPWAFKVKDARYFFDQPILIDAALRSRLDAFKGIDPFKHWGWIVQSTRALTKHDFEILVGRL